MKIEFTNEEQEYLESDKETKLRCKKDTPDEIVKRLKSRIEAFNSWIDELNGEKNER